MLRDAARLCYTTATTFIDINDTWTRAFLGVFRRPFTTHRDTVNWISVYTMASINFWFDKLCLLSYGRHAHLGPLVEDAAATTATTFIDINDIRT